jgi:hypothetical protein
MDLLTSTLKVQEANRITEVELRQKSYIKSSLNEPVVATWLELGSRGTGQVRYNGKEYTTIPKGFTSLKRGDSVTLSFSSGYYFSDY